MNRHNRIKVLLLVFTLITVAACNSNDSRDLVRDQDEYRSKVKQINPGDTIVLANGEWRDFEIVFTGKGTKEQPITLTAEEKGKVFITGQSNLRLAGDHLVVSGLVFKDGYTLTDSVISFRKNKQELANNSRVTEVVIDNFNNPERYENDYWVAMYGKNNRFDHSHLEGKKNKGVTFAVRLDTESSQENHHRIDHNYFGPRPILGGNGGETLRIGTSHYSMSDSFTRVENNYFDRCDGELEIISVKSGGNHVSNNVFYQSRGTLTLRHGNGNFIENNIFQGNGADHTGGIRVINKQQTVRNNYMEGLAGYRFGGALVVMNGVPNSPINRYHQVDGAIIENNTIIDSGHIQLAAGSDQERSATPINSRFSNNLVVTSDDHDIFTVYDDVSGIEFDGNLVAGHSGFAKEKSFEPIADERQRGENGLIYLNDPAAKSKGVSKSLSGIAKDQTGVSWYPKNEAKELFRTGSTKGISATPDAIINAVAAASAGDVISLSAGHYKAKKTIIIDKPITIMAEQPAVDKTPSVKISFERSALFEIVGKGSLELVGINISGEDSPDSSGNTVMRTSRYSMLENYQLRVSDSVFSDLDTNHSFSVLKAAKGTLADRIEISNTQFLNVDGTLFILDQDIDDAGRYNAEYLTIKDSGFVDVTGALVNYYRGGTDESTFGPHFELTNSVIKNSGFGKRNKADAIVGLHGVQVSLISDNRIVDSESIRINHTVGEPVTRISNNQFVNTEMPVIKELNSIKENTAIIENNQLLATSGAGNE